MFAQKIGVLSSLLRLLQKVRGGKSSPKQLSRILGMSDKSPMLWQSPGLIVFTETMRAPLQISQIGQCCFCECEGKLGLCLDSFSLANANNRLLHCLVLIPKVMFFLVLVNVVAIKGHLFLLVLEADESSNWNITCLLLRVTQSYMAAYGLYHLQPQSVGVGCVFMLFTYVQVLFLRIYRYNFDEIEGEDPDNSREINLRRTGTQVA